MAELGTGVTMLGGGVLLYLGAEQLGDKAQVARLAGIGVGLVGAWQVFSALREKGALARARDAVLGSPDASFQVSGPVAPPLPQILAGPGTSPAPPSSSSSAPFVIPYGIDILSPAPHGTAHTGYLSTDYRIEVRLLNRTARPVTDVVSVKALENWPNLPGVSDEIATGTSELVTVPPGVDRLVSIDMPLAGGTKILAMTPHVIATIGFAGHRATTDYFVRV